VRCSTVAHAPFSTVPTIKGPGRPRQWGSKVKLQTLFAPIDQCQQAQVWLYGQLTTYYQCFELYWDSPKSPVLFVLTQLPNGKHLILLSSDLSLRGPEVIAAYGLRFKIEQMFKDLKTSGYSLEQTRVNPCRFGALLLLIMMAYTTATLYGRSLRNLRVNRYAARVQEYLNEPPRSSDF
jgi:hypothetical protein